MFCEHLLLVDKNKKYSKVPETFPKSFVFDKLCTLDRKSLCLEEPIWLWIYLPNFKSELNWLLHIQEPSIERNRTRKW